MEIKSGNIVTLTGCNGFWLVVFNEGQNIKVQPEDIDALPVWVFKTEVTGVLSKSDIDKAREEFYKPENAAVAQFSLYGAWGA
jgi:hypothetical protein